MSQHLTKEQKVMAEVTAPLLASYGLPVAGAYQIEDRSLDGRNVRVVVPDWTAGEDWCWPLLEPDLVDDFVHVGDEQTLLRFNHHYGLLGYDVLYEAEMRRREEDWHGDPVDWAIAHARTASGILGVINIIDDVRSGRVKLHSLPALHRALSTQFEKMGLRSTFAGEPRRFTGFAWSRPEAVLSGGKEETEYKSWPRWSEEPIGTAYRVLAWVLNSQIAGLHFEFVTAGYHLPEPRFGLELRYKALLQVIYWNLAERVGGAFRQCPNCGLVFPMRTPKDKYCSRRCLDAFKSRAWRKRQRAKRLAQQQKRGRKG